LRADGLEGSRPGAGHTGWLGVLDGSWAQK